MIITIEGSDASGKETQSKLLYEYFIKNEIGSKLISFPNYSGEASILAKMYLNGDFGKNPGDVNSKATSIFFACDRFASYKLDWEENYKNGDIIVIDRYTTSNAIHQGAKIEDDEEIKKYLEWLFDLEFNIFSIPKPDITFFLNMPFQYSFELMKNRKNKISGEEKKDIHESNVEYMKKTYENSLMISEMLKWNKIDCIDYKGNIKSKEEIHLEILSVLNKYELKK